LCESTSRDKVDKELLFGTFTGNAATRNPVRRHGQRTVKKSYWKKYKNACFIVDHGLSFLAASPDGLVDNNALVEIKCPASAKSMSPEDGISMKKIKCCEIKDGQLHLKHNHNYYYQVQEQLHISNKLYCYFCIWEPKGLRSCGYLYFTFL